MSKYSETELDHLNHEYSPSEHAKRYKSAEEAIQGHIQLIERGKHLTVDKKYYSMQNFWHANKKRVIRLWSLFSTL